MVFCIFQSFPLHLLTRKECNDLMKALGFYNYKDVVPENKQTGPYVRDETEMTKIYKLLEEKEIEAEEALRKEKEEAERKRREEDEKEAGTCGLDGEDKDGLGEENKEKRDAKDKAGETVNDGEAAQEKGNTYIKEDDEAVKKGDFGDPEQEGGKHIENTKEHDDL